MTGGQRGAVPSWRRWAETTRAGDREHNEQGERERGREGGSEIGHEIDR